MRCSILAVGSRGDVHPLLAVGAALKNAGLEVTFASHRDYEADIARQGFTFQPIDGNATRFLTGAAGDAFRERVRDPRKFKQFFDNYFSSYFQRLLRDSSAAARDADVILSWSGCAAGLAERLGVPVFVACPYPPPYMPTWAYPNPYQGPYRFHLGPLFNRLTWVRARAFLDVGVSQVNSWRREQLGLGDTNWRDEITHLRRLPHLLGISPTILPKPWGWRRSIHVTGTWSLNGSRHYDPAPELQAFLDAGLPPIAIGFSSQVGRQPGVLAKLVVDAVTEAKQRAVLITGFGGLKVKDPPPHVFPVTTVPYDWLLPRVAALVHQGGSGSTALACQHGVPSFAVPFGFDQTLWGDRLHALGVGPRPISASSLTVDRLARALHDVASNTTYRTRAQAVSVRMRSEHGAQNAAAIVLAAIGR